MDVVWPVLGAALIVVGLSDVFLTVLHNDAAGFLAPRLYRWTWVVARRLTAPLPAPTRDRVRSLVAPAMVVLTLAVWLGALLVGFALVFYPEIMNGGFRVEHGLRPSLGAALYFSAATLSSLGFNDLFPRSLPYHALAAAETLLGLGVLTLSISYVLNLYRVLQEQNALSAALHHQAEDGDDPRSILAPHFIDGRPVGLSTHLREFQRSLVDQAEGMRRYPIVYYFKSRRTYRSIPYIFRMLGGVVAALRWGLPSTHEAAGDPWLPSLVTGYKTAMREVEHHFVPSVERQAEPEPLDFERFAAVAATAGDTTAGDATAVAATDEDDDLLAQFLALDGFMRGLARMADDEPDLGEAYERYRRWLPFATESAAFVSAMAADLGVDLGHLAAEPAVL